MSSSKVTLAPLLSEHRNFIMGLSIIFIMLYHEHFGIGLLTPFGTIGLWGVDVFQFISGFGCVFALNKYNNLRKFYLRRVNRLLPCCIFIGISIYCLDFFFNVEVMKNVNAFYRISCLHRWYIPLILFSYFCSPFFYKILKRHKITGLVGLIVLCNIFAITVTNSTIMRWQWIFFRLSPFIMGMWCVIYDIRITKQTLIIGIGFFLCAVIYSIYSAHFLPAFPWMLWSLPLALSLSAILFLTCKTADKLKHTIVYRVLSTIGIYTLEIYLIHEYLLWVIMPYETSTFFKIGLFLFILIPATKLTSIIISSGQKRIEQALSRQTSA